MTYRDQFTESEPEAEEMFTGQWQNRATRLDAYEPYLDRRWQEGCRRDLNRRLEPDDGFPWSGVVGRSPGTRGCLLGACIR